MAPSDLCPCQNVPVVQVHSSAKSLRLVTFDADGTLYADGCHMEHDNEMVSA